jgi:hypothetical protein
VLTFLLLSSYTCRDGKHFRVLLNYLRTGELVWPLDETKQRELQLELEFYQFVNHIPHDEEEEDDEAEEAEDDNEGGDEEEDEDEDEDDGDGDDDDDDDDVPHFLVPCQLCGYAHRL